MAIRTDSISPGSGQVHLPLEPLFTLLHNNGFKVKPDDYVEMLKVTERFGSNDIDETAKWICPIIATSEGEQIKFFNLIEEYKKLFKDETKKPINKIHVWQKIAFPIAVLGILSTIIYFFLKPVPVNTENIQLKAELGKPVNLNTSQFFKGREKDTSKVKVSWNFPDGQTENGADIQHVFNREGSQVVIRKYASSTIPLVKTTDTAFVNVCRDLFELKISPISTPVLVDSSFSITAAATADNGTVSYYRWTINDSVFETKEPAANNLRIGKEGNYPIECIAVVGDIKSPCSITASGGVQVIANGVNYAASFTHFNNKTPVGGKASLKGWVHFALLIPAFFGIFYTAFKRKRKRPATGEQLEQTVRKIRESSGKQVYDIPFERTDLRVVQPEKDLRMVLLQMRTKAEEENLVLNIPNTISSIIRSGGSPQLVYTPQTRPQDFLILIDNSNSKSMMTHLFEYMAGTMQESGIPLTCFYYDKKFNCTNKQHPYGLSLKRLAELYEKSTLIIMGKAHELVYRAYPVIEEKFDEELRKWEQKAIITPVPSCDWDSKEKVLLQHFILLPADILSLQKLVPSLKEKIKLQKEQLEDVELNRYTTLYVDFRDVEKLKAYLDHDEVLFQWICAACVYPRLRWEVLVEVGRTILEKYGQPEKMNYTTLLKICRISWMQEGVFPQSTRFELLKQLSVENELLARETLQKMLVNVSILYKGNNYAFEEERKRQQLTNEFILYSNNPKAYPQFASSEENFRKLWGDDAILDVPLKKYLEKPAGSDWQTPVQSNNVSVSVPVFFKIGEKKDNEPVKLKRIGSAAISLLLLALWAYLAFVGGAGNVQGLELYRTNNATGIPYRLVVRKDFKSCNDTSSSPFVQNIMGSIVSDSASYPANYDAQTGVVSFVLPYDTYQKGKGSLSLDWSNGGPSRSVQQQIDFSAATVPDTVLLTCSNYVPTPENKVPETALVNKNWTAMAPNNLPSALREIWKGQSANRLVFFDLPGQRVYYSTQGKSTYGTYKIDSVFHSAAGLFKLYTSGAGNQFRTFYIQNVNSSFFDISVCPMVGSSQQLSGIEEASCNPYERMTLYYENTPENIYLPIISSQLVSSEKRKLNKVIMDSLNLNEGINFDVFIMQSKPYTSGINYRPLIDQSLQTGGMLYQKNAESYSVVDIRPSNPFNRSYIQFSINYNVSAYPPKQQRPAPDCSVTFTSLAEIRKSPLSVCKADLSALTLADIPKDLFECKNLQTLTVKRNQFPDASIKNLQSYVPYVKIVYIEAPQNANWTVARTIIFRAPGRLESTDVAWLLQQSKTMSDYPDAIMRLEAHYNGDKERSIATTNVDAIKKELFTMKLPKGFDQVTEQYINDALQKKSGASVFPKFNMTTALGAGEVEYESDPTYRVIIYTSGFPGSSAPAKK